MTPEVHHAADIIDRSFAIYIFVPLRTLEARLTPPVTPLGAQVTSRRVSKVSAADSLQLTPLRVFATGPTPPRVSSSRHSSLSLAASALRKISWALQERHGMSLVSMDRKENERVFMVKN